MSLVSLFSCPIRGLRWLALAMLPTLGLQAAGPVLITEFMANNTSGLRDEDGAYSDWIELFNTSTSTVNLNGWFLTDSTGNLTRWRLPATNLPPSGFLVVFASGKDRAVVGRPLHANFSLSASGEYLALVKPDGASISSEFKPQYPPQYPDFSFGPGQEYVVTRFVTSNAPGRILVPPNGLLWLTWTSPSFDDSSWQAATNGIGYETYLSGFAVRNIRANVGVCDLATAEAVLADPSRQAALFTANPPVINYLNTGSSEHFGGDATFPGFTIGVDMDNFVTEATGIITIPYAGNWTFGVDSDDGFRVTLGTNVFEYPPPRAPTDSFTTFNLAAGDYTVRLVFYECGGGSEVEFFAAPGSYSQFNSSFALVGAANGLAVKSLPGTGGGGSLRPLIATDLSQQMAGKASSAFARFPFGVANPAALSSLTLRMKYNDGFVAFLNGMEVARRNFSGTPQWNSVASPTRPIADAFVFEDIDLTGWLNLVQPGTNLLAMQGLNESANASQFFLYAELVENKLLSITNNHYFAVSTPGTFNSLEYAAFVSDLKFSPNRGWFNHTNISVTITSATPGVTIYYTTNGSLPGPANGSVYTGPLPLSRTTVLRAVGYQDAYQPSMVETHSYLFLDQVQLQSTNVNYAGGSAGNYTLDTQVTQTLPYRDTFTNDLLAIPTLSLSLASDDFFGPNGIWSNPQGQGVAWERACSAEYMRPDGKKGFHLNCGLRIQGGVSRSAIPKHSLRLLFKGAYGPSKLDYTLYPDSPVREFDTLSLHAAFNDHWLWGGTAATMQRDQFCRDTQNALGGFAGHGTYAHLYINGLYWGVYNIGEKSDDAFAASYLGGEKEDYDARTADEFITGTDEAWNTLMALANAGITTDAAYTNIAQHLDIPNFIDYLLMNFYVANVDWPVHNWTAARRRVPAGGYHFFSWDAEWVLGIGSSPGTDRTGISGSDGLPGALYAGLRGHPEFRRLFGDLAQKHCFNQGALTPDATAARWSKTEAELDRAIVGEAARWGGGNSRETWLAAEAQVQAWFPQRTATLIAQLRTAGLYPQLDAPRFLPGGGLLTPGTALTITNPNGSGVLYFTLDGSDPRLWGGGLAASARAYAAPLSATNAAVIRARVLNGADWSALAEATFYVLQDFSHLVLTEIMYHPPNWGATNGDLLEFVELKNTGTNTLELSGLQFTDGIDFTFTNGTRLGPGRFFVLVSDAVAFGAKYPGITANGVYTGRLADGGEHLTLAHTLGTNVLSFGFGSSPPWPALPDGQGFSLVRANYSGSPDEPSSWRASSRLGGSPGAEDPPFTIPPIQINEILTHTDPPQVDSIELYNPLSTNVNLGGWFLSDRSTEPKKFRIPNPAIIPPGGYALFAAAQFNPVPGVEPSFSLSSWGESLYLFSGDAATNLTGYSHSLTYGPSANGVSFGRYVISTGEEQWPAQSALTLGTNNAVPRVGPVVINEILYHPAVGYDEFVELYNLSASSIPLFDSAYPTNGWRLNGVGYTFSSPATLPPGGYLVLAPIAPATFRAKYSVPANVQVFGPYPGALQGGGERLRLERPDTPDTNGVAYIVVDEVRYRDHAPWPAGADGDGPSLQRRNPSDYGNEPLNWFASGITPGLPNALNLAPTCSLVSPTDHAIFFPPTIIQLRASAADLDGTVARVEFYDFDVKIADVTNVPFVFTWTNASVGLHRILAKARDNALAVGVSTPANITVQPPPVGAGTGLRGDYYDNIDFSGLLIQRTDATVDFDWGTGSPLPSLGADTFSVRWTGKVQPRYTGTFTFYTVSDDGVRLWVNNQLVIDNWTDHAPTENFGFIPLEAGRLYDLKMEFYENGGGATARLFWSGPSVPKEVIPTTQLYLPSLANQPPSVRLSSPAANATFLTGSGVVLSADAFDPDGSVARVDFYAGSDRVASVSSNPFLWTWSNAPAGTVSLSAVATDNLGLCATSAPITIAVLSGFSTNVVLVATNAIFTYRDTGEDLGSAWTLIAYDDHLWSAGPAPLGFGNGAEATTVSYGPNPSAKFITTFVRRSFFVSEPTVFESLNLSVVREDGVAVYLNGSPVWRDNLPTGPVSYLTRALSEVTGAEATNTFHSVSIDAGYLVPGTNVLAAELHLYTSASPGLRWEAQLTGRRTVYTIADTDHDGMPDAWELAHGLDPGLDDADLDIDGDGMTNLQEYLAGTDPLDPNSRLSLTLARTPDAALQVQFEAVSNHTYTVETSDSIDGPWASFTNVTASPVNRVLVLPVNLTEAARFFRLVTPAR